MDRCKKCIHYCVCMVNSYCHESCGYYEPPRPVGEWIQTGYYTYCSICGNSARWSYNFCPICGAKMVERGLRAKMGLIDDAIDEKLDLEYFKIGSTIYTQDDDKQGWTGREG